jgi:hypothetical protein
VDLGNKSMIPIRNRVTEQQWGEMGLNFVRLLLGPASGSAVQDRPHDPTAPPALVADAHNVMAAGIGR